MKNLKIKEVSHYRVEDEEGNLLKKGFHDIEDAYEYGVNKLLTKEDIQKIVIKGEITISRKN